LANFIDRYKYGLLAALGVYIGLFMYFNMVSYTRYYPIESFEDEGAFIEVPDDEIQLKPENIFTNDFNNNSDVKNASRDMNETRENNKENVRNYSDAEIEAQYRDIESQMYEEAGGESTREEILAEMERRKEVEQNKQNDSSPNKESSDNSYNEGGNVMVKWDLKNRPPHQNNDWYVRNPGYKCGAGSSGTVAIAIQVGQNGKVLQADYIADKSSNANSCMKEEALKYAKMSRFQAMANAEKSQAGYIYYTFVSQ